MTPARRFTELVRVDLPLILAPMAGPGTPELALAVAEAGALASLPCAMSTPEQIRRDVEVVRRGGTTPVNLNFFCHTTPPPDAGREDAWRARLLPYATELRLEPSAGAGSHGGERRPFDAATCALVEELRPAVVSFHFGLPAPALLARVKAAGAIVLSSATTVAEARWLEERGCDVVIAQGAEAGGHRGMFLETDPATQVGTISLLPRVVDAVRVPVVAAGGIADARGIAAALVLGASAVQLGTAYLLCPEAKLHPAFRAALGAAEKPTAITNVFSGRPARGIVNRAVRELGPMAADAPAFPRAAIPMGPLRAKAEAVGSVDFTSMWAGQAAALGRSLPAGELTRALYEETRALLGAASALL